MRTAVLMAEMTALGVRITVPMLRTGGVACSEHPPEHSP